MTGPPRRPRALGQAALLIGLLGAACAPFAAPAPPAPLAPPSTPAPPQVVSTPPAAPAEARRLPDAFRPGEIPGMREGRPVRLGSLDGVAYTYTADLRAARVAARPGAVAPDLAYASGDWRITCGPSRGQNRCTLELAAVPGAPEPVLRILYAPFTRGPRRTVCGPPGGAGALRATPGPWRRTGPDGCLKPRFTRDVLAELKAARAVTWRGAGPDTRLAGRDLHGLETALALMEWLQWRMTAGG
jgi:hypothetical protein